MIGLFEPVWAIGTGKVATTDEIAEVHAFLRVELRRSHPSSAAEIRLLYGGSVKASNAAEIFAVPDVDGALVGGASLTAEQFLPHRAAPRSLVGCAFNAHPKPTPPSAPLPRASHVRARP